MLISSSELSASTADAVLDFGGSVLASAFLCFCTSSRFGKFVIVISLGLVAPLAIVRALCNLTNRVLELCRLDEVNVLHQASFFVHAS